MRQQLKRLFSFRVGEPVRHLFERALARSEELTATRLLVISDDLVYTSEQQIAPMRAYRRGLRAELGVTFAHTLVSDALALPSRLLSGFDAMLLKLSFRTPAHEVLEVARALRRSAGPGVKLLYLDGDDDLCVQWPDLLPHVDLYVKKHVFSSDAEYTRARIGKTNLTDYVARTFGTSFEDDPIPSSRGVGREQLHKIVLGWNVALDDTIRSLHRPVLPSHKKDVDVVCRASLARDTWIRPLRSPISPILRGLSPEYRVLTPEERVPPHEYYRELTRSRICVSPFGFGELCWRDFEAILRGCLVIKPDVAHLRTEPDVFVPFESYVPVRWDFADLEERVRHYLVHPDERARIAKNARERLTAYYDGGFLRSFSRVLSAAGLGRTRAELRGVEGRQPEGAQ